MVQCERKNKNKERRFFSLLFATISIAGTSDLSHFWAICFFFVLSKTLIGSFLRKPENYAQYAFAEISTHVLLFSRHTGIAAHINPKANAHPKMATITT